MDSELADVAKVVPTRLVDHEGDRVTATFSYRVDEPYAVAAALVAGDIEIEWTFARDLLFDGLSFPTGEGDVLVAPGTNDQVQLTLRSSDGAAGLLCDRTAVQEFVERIYAAVPAGDESGHLDMDELLAQLAG
jgi:hypothetical protein